MNQRVPGVRASSSIRCSSARTLLSYQHLPHEWFLYSCTTTHVQTCVVVIDLLLFFFSSPFSIRRPCRSDPVLFHIYMIIISIALRRCLYFSTQMYIFSVGVPVWIKQVRGGMKKKNNKKKFLIEMNPSKTLSTECFWCQRSIFSS